MSRFASRYINPIIKQFLLLTGRNGIEHNNTTYELPSTNLLQAVDDFQTELRNKTININNRRTSMNVIQNDEAFATALDICFRNITPLNDYSNCNFFHVGTMNWIFLSYFSQLDGTFVPRSILDTGIDLLLGILQFNDWIDLLKKEIKPNLPCIVTNPRTKVQTTLKRYTTAEIIKQVENYEYRYTHIIDLFSGSIDPLYCLALGDEEKMKQVVKKFHICRKKYADIVFKPLITQPLEYELGLSSDDDEDDGHMNDYSRSGHNDGMGDYSNSEGDNAMGDY